MARKGFATPIIIILLLLIFFGFLIFLKQKSPKHEDNPKQNTSINNQDLTKSQPNDILFVRNRDIYLFHKDQQQELLIKSGQISKLVWAPDNTLFFYSENVLEKPIQGGYLQKNSIYDFKNKKILSVSDSFKSMQGIKWTNDSKRILGTNSVDYLPVIYDLESRTAAKVSVKWKVSFGSSGDSSQDVRFDQWDFSPDGTQLVFLTNEGKLYIQDLKSGSSRLLGESSRLQGPVLWSPNGQDVVFIKSYETTDITKPEGDLTVIHQDSKSMSESKSVGEVRFADNDAPHPVIWSNDGNKLLLYSSNQIYDIQKIKEVTIVKGEEYARLFPGAGAEDVAWISNNLLIGMGRTISNDKNVDYYKAFYKLVLLDTDLGTFKVYDIKSEPKLTANIASISPDGQNILIRKQVSDQKTSDLYNFDLKEQKETLLINNAELAAWGK